MTNTDLIVIAVAQLFHICYVSVHTGSLGGRHNYEHLFVGEKIEASGEGHVLKSSTVQHFPLNHAA